MIDEKLDVEACGHCWHQFGPASGGIGTNGTTMRGTNRCCHCGKLQTYDIVIPPSSPVTHGPFLLTINGEPKMSDTVDVEACVRLLEDLILMLDPHDAQGVDDANQLRALKLALSGMGKDGEPTVAEVIAWMEDRPGCSWMASVADIHEAVRAIRHARAAQPEETKP